MVGEYISKVVGLYNRDVMPYSFSFGNVRRLDLNNKFIYLWQDAKGQVCYCFGLLDKEYVTTSATKLGNALSSHFQTDIEVLNNSKEHLKRMTSTTVGVSKAVSDLQKYEDYADYREIYNLPSQHFDNNSVEVNGIQSGSNVPYPIEYKPQPKYDQKQLHQNVVQLTTYSLKSNLQTIFILINELPIVHKEVFRPEVKLAFFLDKDLMYKNNYIPSVYQVAGMASSGDQKLSILSLIFYMANEDLSRAMYILRWLAEGFCSLNKLPFVLVLHSEDDVYMKLLYEEIIMPLFNTYHCEKISNEDLADKSLSSQLDQKVIYNFHNVTTPTVLGAPATEFMNRLIHKDTSKLKSKVITTVANTLITSTTNYIPLIDKDVPSIVVPIASSIEALCKKLNISSSYYALVKQIENGLDHFSYVLRSTDVSKLDDLYPFNYYGKDSEKMTIMDGNTDVLEVFNLAIKNKDVVLFKRLETKSSKLHGTLVSDFAKDRVNRKNLIEYFTISFGEGSYTSNRALVSALKDLSDAKEPFDNITTFNNNGSVYYRL